MSLVPPEFRRWVHKQHFGKRKEGDCTFFVIRHLGAGKGKLDDVDKVPALKVEEIEEGEADATVDRFAFQLHEIAEQDANGFQGVQTYAFLAFFEENPEKHVSRYTLRIVSSDEDEESPDASVSEPANGTGLTAQAMRHSEAFARIGTQASMHQMTLQQRTIQTQADLIERLASERMESFKLIEELYSRKHERDMEVMEKTASLKTRTELIERVTPLLPVIAAKLTGMPLLPKGDDKNQGLRAILSSIDETQMGQLQAILRPEQMGLLAEMMVQMQSEDEAKKALPENTNGEAH